MAAKRSTRFCFLLLAAVLFALHVQFMPRIGHAGDQQTESAAAVVLHEADCGGDCCRGTTCCIQVAFYVDRIPLRNPPACFVVASATAMSQLMVKPLYPPPRTAIA